MAADSVQDSNRYVVTGDHSGPVLPARHADLGRKVYLKTGARVRGGVLGGGVEADGGPITVEGSIYSTGDVAATAKTGVIALVTCVAARQSVKLIGASGASYVRVGGDVSAPVVSLSGCIVYGNVYAQRVVLENSVVLGTVHADTELRVRNAIVGTFAAGQLVLEGSLQLLSPVAHVRERFDFSHSLSCLAFENLGAYLAEAQGAGSYAFSPEDLKSLRTASSAGAHDWFCLSIAPRVLNLRSKREALRKNMELLRSLTLRELIHPDERPGKPEDLATIDRSLLRRTGVAAPAVALDGDFDVEG